MNKADKNVKAKKTPVKKRRYVAPTVVLLDAASVTGSGTYSPNENPIHSKGPQPQPS